MPQNKAAWLVEPKANPFVVKEAPYPTPGKGEVVVKHAAAAINPVENHLQDHGAVPAVPFKYPNILGQDVAGEVVEAGPEVTGFKVGDRIIVHTLGLFTGDTRYSGFQLYSLAKTVLTSKIPDSLKFEQAVVLPLAVSTAANGLYEKDQLDLPFPSLSPQPTGKVLLVWGGGSSVGSCATQLALASGFEVWTTASKKNFDYCKALGASQVFDYNSPTIAGDIVTALHDRTLGGVYDAISTENTIETNVKILRGAPNSDKKLTAVLPIVDFDTSGVQAGSVIAPTISNTEVGPAVWRDYLPKALEQGKFAAKPDPLIVGTGLEAIQPAVDKMKMGVSAAKLVVLLNP